MEPAPSGRAISDLAQSMVGAEPGKMCHEGRRLAASANNDLTVSRPNIGVDRLAGLGTRDPQRTTSFSAPSMSEFREEVCPREQRPVSFG